MQPADLAIQIVNYKTKTFLNPLIESILKDIAPLSLVVEIHILDNASGDNLEDIQERWRSHNLHVYAADTNRGFGAGHNILAGKTTARNLLILNPDILFIEPRTIARLLETLERTQAAVVGPRLLTPQSREHSALHELSLDQLKPQEWDHGKHGIWRYHTDNETSEVAWVSGAVFLTRRQTFMDIGGFDEKFFLYFEEVDVCLQLRKQAKSIVYDPHIQVLHFGSAVARKRSSYMLKSLLYYERKKLKR